MVAFHRNTNLNYRKDAGSVGLSFVGRVQRSESYKENLLETSARYFDQNLLSPVNDELLPARHKVSETEAFNVPVLNNWQEEADCRLVPHSKWAVDSGSKRLLILSNDTDSVALLLRFISVLKGAGLKELWVEFGHSEKRRKIPIHILHERLGNELSRVLFKAHCITGNDVVSKIGTKHAALKCHPERYLSRFAETEVLTEIDFQVAEEYLVQVWAGVRSKTLKTSFDSLRLEAHRGSVVSLDKLPPTSSSIRGHIRRAFFAIRNGLTLLDESAPLDPTDYGWKTHNGLLLPQKHMLLFPTHLLTICGCSGKCNTSRCACIASGVTCVTFCHKKAGHENCENE